MRNLRELGGYSEEPRHAMATAPAMRRMPPLNQENEFFHFDFLRALQMHRKLALGILIAAAVLSLAYVARRWNSYKAQALVYVQPSPPKLLGNSQSQQWPYDANTYESYIQQQIHDVTRPDVLVAALSQLPGWKGSNESEQAAADRLGSSLEVARVGSGYQISITASAGSAEEAATIANAVAKSYIVSATRELRSGDTQRIQLLSEERDRVLKELASDRTEQEDLNKKLGVAGVGTTPDPYDDQISAVRSELVKARTDSDQAAARLMAEARGGESGPSLNAAADELVASDPGLVSMKTELNKRRSVLISQMSNLTPNNPEYKQDADEVAKINASLDQMSKDLRTKAEQHIEQRLKDDLERTESVEARLNSQLGQLTGAAGSATPRLQRESDLAADINRLQNRYTVVDEQFRNLSLENNAPGAVYVSADAMAPLHAARNIVLRNGFIILLAGLLFAVGAALIAHNMDPRVYIAKDVERVLGFAPMALLPDLYEVGTGVAEEYMLRLAAAVEHAHQQGALNSCIFTGVTPGAGATTVSTRVSSMLEAMGRETMLVDAVGAPPTRPAEGSLHAGSELVHLPRGSRSTALLQQMTEQTNEETVVVTDTAPLLVSGETEYLARFVDAAIIVVESGVTTRAQLREVARTLGRLDVSAVGFVLNRIPMAKADPSFRHSVRAVEKHLRSQSRGFDRPAASEAPAENAAALPRRKSPLDRRWNLTEEPVSEAAIPTSSTRSIAPEAEKRQPSVSMQPATPAVAQVQAAPPAEKPAYTAYLRQPEPPVQPVQSVQPVKPVQPAQPVPPVQSVQPAQPVAKDWQLDEPSYVHFLRTTGDRSKPTVAPVVAEPAVAPAQPKQTEPFRREPAATAAPVPAAAPATRDNLPGSVSKTPRPAVDFSLPEYIVQAAEEAVEHRLPTYLRRPSEPQTPSPAPQAIAQETMAAPRPVAIPEPVPDVPVAAQQQPAPPESYPDTRPESRPAAAPYVARPMRGREPVRPVPVESRAAQSPAVQDPAAEAAHEPETVMTAQRDHSVMVMPPVPGARKAETPHEVPILTAQTQPGTRPVEPQAAETPDTMETISGKPSGKPGWSAAQPAETQPPVVRAPEPPMAQQPAPASPAPVDEFLAANVGPEVDAEDLPYSAASRLGGLRNLLVTLGIKNLHREAEFRKAGQETEPRIERIPERPVYAQPETSPANPGEPGATAVVMARPEIIPPRLPQDTAEREKEPSRAVKSPKLTRWDSPDEFETLPSRRGQYRRRT